MQTPFNLLTLTAKELFQQEFDAIYLEDKIALAEQISFCILKKIENQTTHKLKLICSKQKCQFSIKLELSPIENKYHLRDIHAEHNHHISKEKFEEKMLTGRLLKFSDFIYKTYFIIESEFCSKPKLILKDLKSKHNLDVLAGNYTAAQKQKLKKKFDNIVQQLRLKKNRVLGIAGTDSMANPTAASLTTAIGSSALLPQFTSGCENGLSSSVHLQSIPMQHAKKSSSTSFPTNRDVAHSLSTAINSIGDSTNKSQKKRNTSSSSSNFDFQNQETVYSPSQNNGQNSQMMSLIQKNNFPTLSMFNNASQFVNPHFQLSFLQQQHMLQQQQQAQQQQLQLQQAALKKISPQVISEDSRSASFCKVEDFGEPQSAASGNNIDSSLPLKQLKVQNSPLTSFQNPINNIACNNTSNNLLQIPIQQQQPHFGANVNNPISAAAGLHTQMIAFPQNYDFTTSYQSNVALPLQTQAQTQPPSAEQQIMMKLHENQMQQEHMKKEEFQLKNLIQQRRIQEQQQQQIQQQQQQAFNHFSPFMLQTGIPLGAGNQQNIIQNSQQFMNLQLLLQNQQAVNQISASKIQGSALLQPGLIPLMSNPSLAGFGNTQNSASNIFQSFPDQNLLLNRIDQQTDLSALRNMQVPTYFSNSGMIPTSSS